MANGAVTLGDLRQLGKLLELGCYACRLHLYVDPADIALPEDLAVPDACDFLKCPQCRAENSEPGYPIWTRPDARSPKMGAAADDS